MTIQELEQCILRYGTEIYSFCMHLTKQKETADDLYQDTFLEATKRMAAIRYEDNPKIVGKRIGGLLFMRELDEWLKQNLISDCVPEERLNAEILKKAKETQTMKHKTTFRSGVAAEAYFAQSNVTENTQTKTDEESNGESALAEEWMQKIKEFGTLSTKEAQAYLRKHAKILWQETYTPDADGNIHVQSDAEVADYNTEILPEEAGVETILAFSSDGEIAGTLGTSIMKNADGTYTYTVYSPVRMK